MNQETGSGTDIDWLQNIPKVELHLHLEGAIPHATLWELVQKYGGDPSVPTRDDLVARFAYRDFRHFLDVWTWKDQFLREYEDFTFVAEQVARDLASQNIRYVEMFYSPGDHWAWGLEVQPLTEAIRAGLNRAPAIEVALVCDLIRNNGPVSGGHLLEELRDIRPLGVVGIGIGGSESQFPPEPFATVYERARKLGFRTSAHAGEAAGPQSVWGAVRTLRVDRIGHGTRAAEDSVLVDYLAEQQIPVELCIISNLKTGVIPSLESHPVRLFFERGIPLSINTDDPKMFGTSLADEYLTLMQLGFSRSEIQTLIEQGINSSWLPPGRKRSLIANFRKESGVYDSDES
ncbi:MAG: adenosine deaminase [Candidatus Poribacteria bacterium]|nr:adenosine deaminase [Candidatus Poribacteria bacterium]